MLGGENFHTKTNLKEMFFKKKWGLKGYMIKAYKIKNCMRMVNTFLITKVRILELRGTSWGLKDYIEFKIKVSSFLISGYEIYETLYKW